MEADFSGGNNYVLLGTQELMSVPYALYASYASKTDTSVLNLAARFSPLNNKLNIIDTSTMLSNYRTGLNNKLNTIDTSTMLLNYKTGLNNKVNILDTASMLQPYLRDADTTSMLLPYLRDADTTIMLANYLTGIKAKVNNADTSDMLNPYLRKADTAFLSERINTKLNSSDFPNGTNTGNMLYWNGTSWVNLATGQNGQALILVNGIPSWSGGTYATLTTSSVSSRASTSVSGGGNISSDGGATVSARGLVYSTSTSPTLSNTALTIGSGTGSFSGTLTGLSPITTYYIRAYATNSAGTAYGNEVSFTTTTLSSITDIDGNTYNTVQIGNQVWMSENLKTSRYRNGGLIPNVTVNTAWRDSTTGAWSNYNHDAANDPIYGKLYNWYTTLGDTLCPTGWGVPTDAEWTTLTDSLGGASVAGGKMKTIGNAYWNTQQGATNVSGFSALPGGYRVSNGSFFYIRNYAFFWSATESGYYSAWFRFLYHLNGDVSRNFNNKSVGASVRCLRD